MRLSILIVSLFGFMLTSLNAQTIYVNANAADGGDGNSWATAFNKLEDALGSANDGDAVWVAAGTYTGDATFFVNENISLLGGFAGTETSADEADPENNTTTLSGDLNGDDMPSDSLGGRADNFRVMAVDSLLSLVTIDGFTFSGGVTGVTPDGEFIDNYSGAAIRTYSPINVSRCAFDANFSDFGSAIALFFGSDNSIINTSVFSGNIGETRGAIYAEVMTNLTVTDSEFYSNSSQRGCVYGQDITGLTVTGCTFDGNQATVRGACIGVVRSEPVLIDNCTFINNVGTRAAAIYLFQNIDANRPLDPHDHIISNSLFDNNATEQRGGAVYELYTNVTLRNNTFSNNSSSTENGGAYYSANSGQVHIIEDCVFENNSAPASRGGAYYSSGAVDVEMRNVQFIDNSSSNRGAAYYMLGSFDTLGREITFNIDSVLFQNNTNDATGGAFYLQSPVNTTRINITNSSFLSNSTSDGLGGAIGGINGFITTIDNCEFLGNSTRNGGGGAIFFNDRLFDDFLDQDSFSLTVTNSIFSSNAASSQGGVFDIRGGLDVTMSNNLFLGNLVSDVADGGAGGAVIFNGDSAKVTDIVLVNNTFNGNTTITLGEDVAFYESPQDQADDPATVMNVTLQNNAFTSENGLSNVAVEDGVINFNSLGGNFYIKEVADDISGDMDVMNDGGLTAEDLFVNTDFASDEADYNPIEDANNPLVDGGTTGDLVPTTDYEGFARVNLPDIGALEAFSPNATEELAAAGIAITFYPNPVVEQMNVRIEEPGVTAFRATLVDMNGRQLGYWNIGATTRTINCSQIPAGSYVLEIELNGKRYSQQLLKL